jgi:Caspase domain
MYIPLLSPSYCPAVRILALTAALILPLGALAQPVTPFKGKAGALPGEGLLPERFALVVGINRYDATGTLGLNDLVNAENDAEGVASELKEAGFEQTFVLTTGRKIKATPNGSSYVTKNEILNRLSTLVSYASKSHERTGRPPIILFYFAGHGLNLDSEDYILPSDFKPSSAEDVRTMGISIMEIVARLSWAKPALRIVISDACRTRSPGTLVRLSKDGETVSLAPGNGNTRIVELGKPPRGANDLFLAFATLADETAADAGEKGEHGKFAGAFIERPCAARANGLGSRVPMGTRAVRARFSTRRGNGWLSIRVPSRAPSS